MQAGTPNIDWLQQQIALEPDLQQLEQHIASVEPGSGGVFWQPYLNGERAPFFSPEARAGYFGISQHTTRAELLRAVFEGLAYAIVDSLQGYPQGGELYLTGGGAASATAANHCRLHRQNGGFQSFNELSAARRGDSGGAQRRCPEPLSGAGADPLSTPSAGAQPLRRALSGVSPAARADAPGVAGPPRGASTYFRNNVYENCFTAEHAGDLSAFQQLGELRVEGWALEQAEAERRPADRTGPRRRGAGDQLR